MTHDHDVHKTDKTGNPADDRRMTPQDFAAWGLQDTAYVKAVELQDDEGNLEGRTAYAIHAANGQPMGVAETRELAFAAILKEGMEPVSAH